MLVFENRKRQPTGQISKCIFKDVLQSLKIYLPKIDDSLRFPKNKSSILTIFYLDAKKNIMGNTVETETNYPFVTSESLGYLQTAGYWGKFLTIMGFIGSCLMILAGCVVFIAGFYVIPSLFLSRFSNYASETYKDHRTETLSLSLKNLKSLFKFILKILSGVS